MNNAQPKTSVSFTQPKHSLQTAQKETLTSPEKTEMPNSDHSLHPKGADSLAEEERNGLLDNDPDKPVRENGTLPTENDVETSTKHAHSLEVGSEYANLSASNGFHSTKQQRHNYVDSDVEHARKDEVSERLEQNDKVSDPLRENDTDNCSLKEQPNRMTENGPRHIRSSSNKGKRGTGNRETSEQTSEKFYRNSVDTELSDKTSPCDTEFVVPPIETNFDPEEQERLIDGVTLQSTDTAKNNKDDDAGDDDGSDDSDLPVDKGYAWVIVFSCLFSNLLCLGMARSYGILFVEFLSLFQQPVGLTTLIIAVQSGIFSVSSLVTQTVVLSLFSERQTMIMGGILGGIGLALSTFATSIFFLLFTQSLLGGIANAFVMGPNMVIVNKYFLKRRAFAMAVATLGGNLGSMVMPLYTQALVAHYGVRGALLILGGTFFNICVAASLLRPLHTYSRTKWRQAVNGKLTSTDDRTSLKEVPLKAAACRDDGTHRGAAAETYHSRGNLAAGAPVCISTPELFLSAEVIDFTNSSQSVASEDGHDENVKLRDGNLSNKNGCVTNSRCSLKTDSVVKENELEHGISMAKENELGHGIKGTKLLEKQGKDFSLRCSSHGQSQDQNNQQTQTLLPQDNQKQPQQQRTKQSVWSRLVAIFDLSLFTRPPFWIIVVGSFFGVIPASLIGTYLPAYAVDNGIVGQRSALLLTIFGSCGIVSRLGFGFLADKNLIKRPFLVSILSSTACVITLFMPLFMDFPLLAFYSVTYGLFGIVYFSLMPVVVVDLVGLPAMTKTLGFMQLFQGISSAVAHPIVGHLRDVTNAYHASFYFIAGCGLTSAFVLLFTPLAIRVEERRRRHTAEVAL